MELKYNYKEYTKNQHKYCVYFDNDIQVIFSNLKELINVVKNSECNFIGYHYVEYNGDYYLRHEVQKNTQTEYTIMPKIEQLYPTIKY